ncbi:MAG: hypothetical protein LBN27_10460 [Prevotellaceae bacterium]|nr:hypothetical protein [Prevotellaceae bacterium]
MKTKSIIIACFSLFIGTTSITAQNKTYPDMWKKVQNFEQKSLPASALTETEKIYNLALRENNYPQVIKALIHRLKFQSAKDNAIQPLIADIQRRSNESTSVFEKAILNSILAEAYWQYYSSRAYIINQRTPAPATDNMEEWSKNAFADKFLEHLNASLTPAETLLKSPAAGYKDVMELGEDSRTLRPTLFDFVAYRALDLLTNNSFSLENVDTLSINIYKHLLNLHAKDKQKDALLYASLEKLRYEKSSMDNDKYIAEIEKLKNQYRNNPVLVEILAEEAEFYRCNNEGVAGQARNDNEINEQEQNLKHAADICRAGIAKFGSYKRINLLKNMLSNIEQPKLNAHAKELVYPKTPISFSIEYTNLKNVTLKIYKIDKSPVSYFNLRADNKKKVEGKLVETRTIDLPQKYKYTQQTFEYTMPQNFEYGIYEYEITAKGTSGESHRQSLFVTRYALLERTRDNMSEFYVVDRMSGQPQKNVFLTIYESKYENRIQKYIFLKSIGCNEDGYATYQNDKQQNIYIGVSDQLADDNYPLYNKYVYKSNPQGDEAKNEVVNLFTDRAVYRPGQTVYFKGIAYNQSTKNVSIIENKTYNVKLFDANYQEVTSQELKTNDFGSFTGEFVLPQGGLSGNYTIVCEGGGNQTFRVEEYKRPSIEVTFEPIRGTYAYGDTLTIEGKVFNYAGYAVRNSNVKYRIAESPRWRYGFSQAKELANGEATTNDKGEFSVKFAPKLNKMAMNYILYVESTDQKGETQKNEFTFVVGDKSVQLAANIADYLKKEDTTSIKLSAVNFNGDKVTPMVSYQIFKILPRKTLSDTASVLDKTAAVTGSIDLAKTALLSKARINVLQSGRYRIVFTAIDKKGRKNTLQKDFILYSETDKKLPEKEYLFVDKLKTECAVGENAEILFGTAAAGVKVLYQVLAGDKIYEDKWLDFSDEVRHLQIPFRAEYGDRATVEILFVKDEKVFSENIVLTKIDEQKLEITFSSFRDKLLPAQQETWTIKIADYKKKGVPAEFLATMYDASLDIFGKHYWDFEPRILGTFSPTWNANIDRQSYLYYYFSNDYNNIKDYRFDSFNWFGLEFYDYQNAKKRYIAYRPDGIPRVYYSKEAAETVKGARIDEEYDFSVSDDSGNSNASPVQIRKNFAETAFFYPQLKTNKKGETLITFKAPESLTRWNFMGLAHTKDLKFGQIAANIVTQKPFMISGNIPRFVRVGDKIVLTAEIANLENAAKSGKATLDIINPQDEKVISTQVLKFKVAGNATTPISWEYSVGSQYDLLIFRLTAQCKDFSDGEQHYVPVLPDKVLVTETLPLNVKGKETKTFTFEKLKNAPATVENKRYTVEFSSNPAWYAIQALPYLSVRTDDNVLSLFSAYYADALASHIVNSNPKIADVFAQWKGDKNALTSQLQENEELKNLLLNETPWVAEAKNETEQMQRIALLFDLNNLTTATAQMRSQLAELQLANGAFPWFKGMREDRFVTLFILDGIAKLDAVSERTSTSLSDRIQDKALAFIDFCIKDDLEQLKKADKNYKTKKTTLTTEQIYYFYVRSAYKVAVPKDVKEAYDFYFAQLEKWTEYSLYEQALIATTMQRLGKKNVAYDIVKSLREHSKTSDEMGMYWEKNVNGYFWSQSAIRTQTALIEAFEEVAGQARNDRSTEEINNMKIWLLKQKQTQMWDSNISTVNAVNALFSNNNDWLNNTENAKISIGNVPLTEKTEAGTGYIKKTYEKSEITPALADISVTKNTDGIAWGAAYWQYSEKINKVTAQNGSLNIDKKLFIEKMSSKGKYLDPLTDRTNLKAGDKIVVRLTVKTDRDMEYVCLKDLRASNLEPVEQLSGYRFREGLGYYQSTKDASVQWFFNRLPKGTYVFEYGLWVSRAGEYDNGFAVLQCQYAPEFLSRTASEKINVK